MVYEKVYGEHGAVFILGFFMGLLLSTFLDGEVM